MKTKRNNEEEPIPMIPKEDRRVLRSKRDLADALEKLLSEKNFDDITVKEISEKAMVSKLTFYNNFFDKNDLLIFLFQRYSAEIYLKIKALIESSMSIKEKYMKGIKLLVDFLSTRPIPVQRMIKNDSSKTLYWILTNFIQEATQRLTVLYGKKLGWKVPSDIASYYYSGAFTNLLYNLALRDVKPDNDKLVQYISMLIGIPTTEEKAKK